MESYTRWWWFYNHALADAMMTITVVKNRKCPWWDGNDHCDKYDHDDDGSGYKTCLGGESFVGAPQKITMMMMLSWEQTQPCYSDQPHMPPLHRDPVINHFRYKDYPMPGSLIFNLILILIPIAILILLIFKLILTSPTIKCRGGGSSGRAESEASKLHETRAGTPVKVLYLLAGEN